MTTPIYKLLPIMAAWWAFSDVTSATTYDEYMTCGAGNGRYGRQYHRHSDLPCDLSKDTFCITPGTQYPWSAVRRFVYENQGLMKRMYGNQRHYNVLRAELLHDLYEEMYDEMPSRQQHRFHPRSSSAASSSSRTARYQKHSNANSLQTEERRKSEEDEENVDSLDRSRAIKIVKAEPEEEYHRRTHQASSSSSSSSHPPSYSSTTTLSSSKPRPESPGNRVKATSMASDKEAADTIEIKDEKLTTGQVTRINTKRPHTSPITSLPPNDPTTISMEGEAYVSDGLHWSPGKEIEGETTTTDHGLPPLVERQQETEDNMWEHFEPTDFPLHPLDDIDIFGEDIWTTLEDQSFDTYSTPPTYSPDFDSTLSTVAQEMFTATPGVGTDPSEELSLDNFENWEAENLKTFTSTTPDIDILTTLGTPARVFEEEVEVRTQGYGHERAEIDLQDEVDENNNPVQKGDLGEAPHNSQGAKEEEEEEREEEKLEIERRENVPATNGVVHKDVLEDVKEQETTPEPMRVKRPVRGVFVKCIIDEESCVELSSGHEI